MMKVKDFICGMMVGAAAATAACCLAVGFGFSGKVPTREYSGSVWRTSCFCSRGPFSVSAGLYWAP